MKSALMCHGDEFLPSKFFSHSHHCDKLLYVCVYLFLLNELLRARSHLYDILFVWPLSFLKLGVPSHSIQGIFIHN